MYIKFAQCPSQNQFIKKFIFFKYFKLYIYIRSGTQFVIEKMQQETYHILFHPTNILNWEKIEEFLDKTRWQFEKI